MMQDEFDRRSLMLGIVGAATAVSVAPSVLAATPPVPREAFPVPSADGWLIARLSLSRVAPFALLQTVVAIAASILFLGESATVSLIGGALICMAGVVLTQSHASPQAATRVFDARRKAV